MRKVEKNIQASTAQLWTGKDFKLRGQKGTQTEVSFYIRKSVSSICTSVLKENSNIGLAGIERM